MNRLQKFVEQGAYGEKSGRVAYAFRSDLLPAGGEGMSWQRAESFSAAGELLKNTGLKEVFKSAIAKGCEVVTSG
jgi:hypothetical protein